MPNGGGRLAAVRGVADLIDHAYSLRYQDHATALAAATRGVDLVERTSIATAGDRDLRAHAWAVLGNSLRIAGRLQDASRALAVADWHRRVGSGALALRIEGCRFRASLSVAQGLYDDASRALTTAQALADTSGDALESARCRVKRAMVASYRGNMGMAHDLAVDALQDAAADVDLLRCALEITMSSLALDDRPSEALDILLASRSVFEGCGELLALKLQWVQGLIAAQIVGHLEGLVAVQARYAERDMGREVGLVALDIATCAARLGDLDTARAQLQAAQPVLAVFGISASLTQAVYGEVAALRRLRVGLSAARTSG